jgi:predicted O-linked N-acetylglucosamine transferase (SPINDLY family)
MNEGKEAVACALEKCLQGQYDQARELLAAAPGSEAELLLAKIDFAEGYWEKTLEAANAAVLHRPDDWEWLKLRQRCWQRLGFAAEDAADCRRLNELRPSPLEHSDLIFKSNFLWQTTPEFLYEESGRWNERYAEPPRAKIAVHGNSPEAERRLKIGYVSPDFRTHAIMRVMPSVLAKYDRQRCEVFAYFIDLKQQDGVTEKLRQSMEHFVTLPPNTEEIAGRVRQDRIDILVDLAGHTMPVEALLAFAAKPAPVQVSWLGVHATTGLRSMDYFLGDEHLPAAGTEEFFSEKVYRLPRAQYCYHPESDPGLVPSPYFQNGYVTFGSFNNPSKLNRETVKAWSVILQLVPGSKLLFKYATPFRAMTAARLGGWFQEDGIAGERLTFAGTDWPVPYMASWNCIDIALDPYPYNGGTTTLDALWMGVPVVSMSGRLAVSCCGSVFLGALGLPVARTLDDYALLAAEMVKMVLTQPRSRQLIRNAMSNSQLMDGEGLVRALETAYRDMWRHWCAGQAHDQPYR